jgi:SAM-dependent methyltransferase
VRTFWREKFQELPHGASVLDIATGNGAIATLASQYGLESQKDLKVFGTDLATIETEVAGPKDAKDARAKVEFHSDTPCEKQPFHERSMDLVTSQFGFEYSDVERTLREVKRLLKPGGRFVAIMHHSSSALIESASEELVIYDAALTELQIFAGLRDYFAALGDLGRPADEVAAAMQEAKPLSNAINGAVNQLRVRFPDSECAADIVGAVSYLAGGAKQASESERKAAVVAAAADFSFAQARLQDMVEAAIDQDGSEKLSLQAREMGFSNVHVLKLYGDDGALAGWQAHMIRD